MQTTWIPAWHIVNIMQVCFLKITVKFGTNEFLQEPGRFRKKTKNKQTKHGLWNPGSNTVLAQVSCTEPLGLHSRVE